MLAAFTSESPTTPRKQKRRAISLREKRDVICEIQNGRKQSDICRERGLTSSTVATIWKRKDELLLAFENSNGNSKKIRKSAHNGVDQMLFDWYIKQDNTISSIVLRTKAEEFGRLVNDEFVCNESWISRWKNRHNISNKKTGNEETSKEKYDDSSEEETKLSYEFAPEEILNLRKDYKEESLDGEQEELKGLSVEDVGKKLWEIRRFMEMRAAPKSVMNSLCELEEFTGKLVAAEFN